MRIILSGLIIISFTFRIMGLFGSYCLPSCKSPYIFLHFSSTIFCIHSDVNNSKVSTENKLSHTNLFEKVPDGKNKRKFPESKIKKLFVVNLYCITEKIKLGENFFNKDFSRNIPFLERVLPPPKNLC